MPLAYWYDQCFWCSKYRDTLDTIRESFKSVIAYTACIMMIRLLTYYIQRKHFQSARIATQLQYYRWLGQHGGCPEDSQEKWYFRGEARPKSHSCHHCIFIIYMSIIFMPCIRIWIPKRRNILHIWYKWPLKSFDINEGLSLGSGCKNTFITTIEISCQLCQGQIYQTDLIAPVLTFDILLE